MRTVTAGFTLWELMVVIALVVFLFVTAIENLLPLRAHAERASFETVVGALRSAVGMETTQRLLDSGIRSLGAMDGMDPMRTLAVTPANYVGEIGSYTSLERGAWGFDSKTGTLFYRVRYPEYFEGSYHDPEGIRFRVIASTNDEGHVNQVNLHQLDSASWDAEGSELLRWMGDTK